MADPHSPKFERLFESSVEAFRREAHGMRDLMVPAEHVDPVEWIESHVELSTESSAEGGSKVQLFGYQKAWVRRNTHPSTKDSITVKGTRTGITQAATALGGYWVHHAKKIIAYYQPTDKKAQKYSNAYWTAMFRASEDLQDIIRSPTRGEIQDTWSEFLYSNGAKAYMNFASSDDQFSGDSICKAFGDEISRWRTAGGGSDGDKPGLVRERYRTFWDGQFIAFSSPRLVGSCLASKEFEDSTKEMFYEACPHCHGETGSDGKVINGTQWLDWGWDNKDGPGIQYEVDANNRVTKAWYVCKVSGCVIDEADKYTMDEQAGNAVYADDDPTPMDWRLGFRGTDIAARPNLIGMRIPQWISLAPGANWVQLAQEWVDAQGSPKKMQVWMNNVAGLPYEGIPEGDPVDVGVFETRRPQPFMSEVPDWAHFIFYFYDTQRGWVNEKKGKARHELMAIAVGPGEEMAVIGYFILDDHAPWSPQANAQLDAIVDYNWKRSDGSTMRAVLGGYDIGFDQTRALEFRRPAHRAAFWQPMKGGRDNTSEEMEKEYKPTQTEISRAIITRSKTLDEHANEFYLVGTYEAKTKADRLLKNDAVGAGFVHFPTSMKEAVPGFYAGLFSEKLVENPETGVRWWKKKSQKRANEMWDTYVGCIVTMELFKLLFPHIRHMIEDGPVDKVRARYPGPDKSIMAEVVLDLELRKRMQQTHTSIVPPARTVRNIQAAAPQAQRRPGGVVGGSRMAMAGRENRRW